MISSLLLSHKSTIFYPSLTTASKLWKKLWYKMISMIASTVHDNTKRCISGSHYAVSRGISEDQTWVCRTQVLYVRLHSTWVHKTQVRVWIVNPTLNHHSRAIVEFVELEYCICKITQYSSPPNSSTRHAQLNIMKLKY